MIVATTNAYVFMRTPEIQSVQLIKLTKKSGAEVLVNPEHIASVSANEDGTVTVETPREKHQVIDTLDTVMTVLGLNAPKFPTIKEVDPWANPHKPGSPEFLNFEKLLQKAPVPYVHDWNTGPKGDNEKINKERQKAHYAEFKDLKAKHLASPKTPIETLVG